MKTKIQSIVWSALLAAGLMAALPAKAQNEGGDKKPRAERPGGQRGDQLARLKQELGLTEEQIEKLKPIFAEQAKEIQAIRKEAGEGADRAALREKMQAVREKYKPQIEAVLTEEQKAKLAEIQAKGPRGQRGGEGAGAPPPPPPAE